MDVSAGLEEAHGLPRHALLETLYRTPTWQEVEAGPRRPRRVARRRAPLLEERAGRALPKLHDASIAARQLIRPNIQLARRLRPAYRTAIVSNADQSLRGRLHELGIHDLFDTVISSAEKGRQARGGDLPAAAARLGLPPEACVFVDDYEANVRAAEELGMRGIVYQVDRDQDLPALLAGVGVSL